MGPKIWHLGHWKEELWYLWQVRPETQSKYLLSNLESSNYDSKKLNQISYKKDLSNNVFHLQSHHKMTAAFAVNKFLFIICFKYTQNIYTLFSFLGNIYSYLPFLFWSQSNFAKFIGNQQFQSLVLLKLHEKEISVQPLSCEFCETFENTNL